MCNVKSFLVRGVCPEPTIVENLDFGVVPQEEDVCPEHCSSHVA